MFKLEIENKLGNRMKLTQNETNFKLLILTD